MINITNSFNHLIIRLYKAHQQFAALLQAKFYIAVAEAIGVPPPKANEVEVKLSLTEIIQAMAKVMKRSETLRTEAEKKYIDKKAEYDKLFAELIGSQKERVALKTEVQEQSQKITTLQDQQEITNQRLADLERMWTERQQESAEKRAHLPILIAGFLADEKKKEKFFGEFVQFLAESSNFGK